MTDWQRYSKPARRAVMIAQKTAIDCRTNVVRPVHVALGCVAVEGNVRRMLESMNARHDIENRLIDLTMQPQPSNDEPPAVVFSDIAQAGVDLALGIATERSKRMSGLMSRSPVRIQTLDLLVGTMRKSVLIASSFKDFEVRIHQFQRSADYMPIEDHEPPVAVRRARPRLFALLGLAGKQG